MQDCFPPALRQPFDEQGRALPGDTEPIAADARPQGDGRSLAGLKIIAGLLGVGLDDLRLLIEVATAVDPHVETLGASHPDTQRLATLSRTPLAGGD